MRPRSMGVVLVVVSVLGGQGCAAVGLTLFGVGAGVTAGTGVSYTLDSVAYKTFTTPVDTLERGTRQTLRRMDMKVTEDEGTPAGRRLVALAADRTIEIELDRLTTQTSRMRVNAKQGWFFKDRATAGEIITQTERTLDDLPRVSEKRM